MDIPSEPLQRKHDHRPAPEYPIRSNRRIGGYEGLD